MFVTCDLFKSISNVACAIGMCVQAINSALGIYEGYKFCLRTFVTAEFSALGYL